MARVVVIMFIVGALILLPTLLRNDRSQVDVPTGTEPADIGEIDNRAAPLDEIDVLISRRSARFEYCETPEDERSLAERKDEWEQMQREVLRVLKSSADTEHLLVAALVSWRDDIDGALELLGEAANRDPGHRLIASQALELCKDLIYCSGALPQLERNLVAADKANVMAWVQVARSRLQRSDEAGALSALREAVAAAMVEDYFVEYVMLFDRALAASSDLPAHERMVSAFGFAAAVFSSAYMVSSDCRERAENSAEWGDVCLRLGERFEQHGRTILTKAIGIGIEINMYEIGGDARSLEQAQARQQEFRASYRSLSVQTGRAEELKDATVFRKYLEIFATGGELDAMQYLADEVSARLPAAPDAQQLTCQGP